MKNKKLIIIIVIILFIILVITGIAIFKNKEKDNQTTKVEEIYEQAKTVDETPESLVGDGSEENPYLIQSIEDLVLISKGVNEGTIEFGKIYSLEADLDFDSRKSYVDPDKINFAELGDINQNGEEETLFIELTTGTGFIPIGKDDKTPFSGEIRGNSYTISNLYSKDAKNYRGLIGMICPNDTNKETKISNLTLKNVKIEGSCSGAVAGYYYQSPSIIIDTCVVTGGNIIGGSGSGGFLGEGYSSNVKIINCKNNTTITGASSGGIIGIAPNNIEIQKSCNLGSIKGDFFVGGIIGDGYNSDVIVKECYNTGDIEGEKAQVAGICAKANSFLGDKCYNTGDVNGKISSGIVIGKNINIENGFNIGKIEGDNIGAIISEAETDYTNIEIKECFYLRGTSGRGVRGIEDIYGKVEALSKEEIKNKIQEKFNGLEGWKKEENNNYPILN